MLSRIAGLLGGIPRLRGERGLTLLELLILMAVIGVLSTIALLVYNDFTYQAQIEPFSPDVAARAIRDVLDRRPEAPGMTGAAGPAALKRQE